MVELRDTYGTIRLYNWFSASKLSGSGTGHLIESCRDKATRVTTKAALGLGPREGIPNMFAVRSLPAGKPVLPHFTDLDRGKWTIVGVHGNTQWSPPPQIMAGWLMERSISKRVFSGKKSQIQCTENRELSRCWLRHPCRHWRLSFWQPPLPPVTTKSASWRLSVFSYSYSFLDPSGFILTFISEWTGLYLGTRSSTVSYIKLWRFDGLTGMYVSVESV